jgi:predicted RNA binding protein YcfA (HicA-like mRNA interferase family)
MPHIGPLSRKDLIFYLHQVGFQGPYSGGRHEFMMRSGKRISVPNPHRADINVALLTRILRQADIDRSEWEKL